MEWNYTQPVKVHFGNGRIGELETEIQNLGGTKGILITSPSFVKRGFADQIMQRNQDKLAVLYSEISPNPDVKECDACVKLIQENQCDFIVSLGGGSVMDCAKAAAAFCKENAKAAEYLNGSEEIPKEALPLIAVPTTAGTGSEITCVSVLSDHDTGRKAPLNSELFYPKVAIVDPELTYSVPPYITACTGMDVLCHAIEAYWSKYHQPVCDLMATQALKLVFKNLETAVLEPENKTAREKMAEASVLAGMAFTIPKTTSAHACSYPLTNRLGIPHGEACGLTVDYFLRINAKGEEGQRLEELAAVLGFPSADALADEIFQLKEKIGLRTDLRNIEMDEEMFQTLVQESQHPNLLNNPVDITEDMLVEMYRKLMG